MENIHFFNQDCVQIENRFFQMILSRSIGPRILSLKLHGQENILAELPEFTTALPDGSKYHFWGGHRLWVAPEQMPITYDHDDKPVEISKDGDDYLITKEVEQISGMQKSMRIKFDPNDPIIHIKHQLTNMGEQPIECAAWAITQLKTGGLAILPQTKVDTGLLPNRSFSLWPYSNIKEEKVTWGNEYILLDADLKTPFKIGFPNQRGWLGYWIDNTLFLKNTQFLQDGEYYDYGSSSECYCCDQFLELETLGPKSIVNPGVSITHVETWKLFGDIGKPENLDEVDTMVSKLNLDLLS